MYIGKEMTHAVAGHTCKLCSGIHLNRLRRTYAQIASTLDEFRNRYLPNTNLDIYRYINQFTG